MPAIAPTPHEAEIFCALSRDLRCILDGTGRIVRWSDCWSSAMGYQDEDLRGTSLIELIDPADAGAVSAALDAPSRTSDPSVVVARCVRRDGLPVWLEWRFAHAPEGGTFVVGHDVTERRHSADTAAALRLLEDEAEQIAGLGSWRLDLSDGQLTFSPEMYRLLGLDPASSEDLVAATRAVIDPQDERELDELRHVAMARGTAGPAQLRIRLGDGAVRWIHVQGRQVLDADGAPIAITGFVQDITERTIAEQALRAREEDLRDAQAIARIGSYVFEFGPGRWTSSATMDDIFGIDSAYARDFVGWAALVHADDRDDMLRYFAEEVVGRRVPFDRQYRVTRPCDGGTVWVHGHGRLETTADGEPVRLVGAIQDVTRRHDGEEALRTTNESLERMVYDVAEAMGRVVEIRDQYTKGHQERTARLAKDIATEMGLRPNDVTAVEMAAVVHDIGKLSVPAEILTRPTHLTELEMSLIREHPHNGFEILKDIPFPWPVADIVLQHHERMDGSGYPAGLCGDQIIPLARVLTVADVVEAMATHRPYRPALGLDAAVAELHAWPEKYDAEVVAACMRLYERGEITV